MASLKECIVKGLADRLINSQTYPMVSRHHPDIPFRLYLEESEEWNSTIKKFGGNPGGLFRTISRMPDDPNYLREIKCYQKLQNGEIPGFFIISDCFNNTIMCHFPILVDGVRFVIMEYLDLSEEIKPDLPMSGNGGFYSYICDPSQSSPEFLKFYQELVATLNQIVNQSYQNPKNPNDHYLIRMITMFKEAGQSPSGTFKTGWIGHGLYGFYKTEEQSTWITLGSNFALLDEVPAEWFSDQETNQIYQNHFQTLKPYIEASHREDFQDNRI